jgi:ATP adenylyltransferase
LSRRWRIVPKKQWFLGFPPRGDTVDQLWAPWRLSYVTTPKDEQPARGNECFICRSVTGSDDRSNLVVYRSELSIVILNRFPYNNGHLLVCPKAHKGLLEEQSSDELLDQQLAIRKMLVILGKRMQPDGFNVGLNLGRAAGAGVPGHLHWHIVPRWTGDTNFMPVLTDTRVIVQSLDALFDLIVEELRA